MSKQNFQTIEERLAKLNKLFGAWKHQPDLIETFEEINKQRHFYRGRKVDIIESHFCSYQFNQTNKKPNIKNAGFPSKI